MSQWYAAKHKGFLPAVKNCLYGPSVAGQPLPVAVGPRSLDCPAAGVALFLLTVTHFSPPAEWPWPLGRWAARRVASHGWLV